MRGAAHAHAHVHPPVRSEPVARSDASPDAPRRARRPPSPPPFVVAPEFSSSTARLVVVLCVTWVCLCVSNRAAKRGVVMQPAHQLPGLPPAPRLYTASGMIRLPSGAEVTPDSPVGLRLRAAALARQGVHTSDARFAPLRAAMHAEMPPGDEGEGTLKYPRNLQRIYDGQWKVAKRKPFPFAAVPVPQPLPRLVENELALNGLQVNVTADATTLLTVEEKFSFTSRTGFTLLHLENHETVFDSLNIVSGDILFRDGPYRSSQDVSLHLVGVYEWKTGLIVAVGDSRAEDTEKVMERLYENFTTRTPEQMAVLEEEKVTKEKFVKTFKMVYMRILQKSPMQRPSMIRSPSVATQCPFTAEFHVKQDFFVDKPPRAMDFGNMPGAPGPAEMPATNLHYSEFASKPDFSRNLVSSRQHAFTRRANGRLGPEQGTGQEEMVKMSGAFTSKKCKTTINIELATLDTETLFVKAINYTLLVTVVAFTQVIVLIRQMEMTSTQAGASRVSLMTVGLQAVADSYLCLGHLTLGIAVQTLFNAFATAAFFKFICFSIFLMRWMLLIWKARRPSGFSEGWEAMRRELSMLYSRFYGSLLVGLFLLWQLQDHLRIFIFALYSFWLPQILLNIVEDHRRPLLPMYILGTSVTRLAIPLYFWGCPKNFLHIHPLPSTAMALVGWMGLQALVLLSQYKFGPRWFIPKALLPEKYDYYRPITLQDDEDDVDIEAQDKNGDTMPLVAPEQQRECCICMETVGLHSRDRMVTPCNHFFHAHCLERWLEVRLECALCRRPVPPP